MGYKIYFFLVLFISNSFISKAQETYNAAPCSYELKICRDTSKRNALLSQTNCPFYDTINHYQRSGDTVEYFDDGNYYKVVDKSVFNDLGNLFLVCTNTKTNLNVKIRNAELFCKVSDDFSRMLTLHDSSFIDYGIFYPDNKQILYHVVISDVIFEENDKLYKLNIKIDYELR